MINKNKPYQQTNDEKETALFIGVAFVLVCVVATFGFGLVVPSFDPCSSNLTGGAGLIELIKFSSE